MYYNNEVENDLYIALPVDVIVPIFGLAKKKQKSIIDLVLNHLQDGSATFLSSRVNGRSLQIEGDKRDIAYKDHQCVWLTIRTKKPIIIKQQTEEKQKEIFLKEFLACDFIYIYTDSTRLNKNVPKSERVIILSAKYFK